ncbi:MAG: VOC family protein [Hyphomicrobiales bacterium]|nr:VOC family protein [Hyphomicrobiales bacterium]
MIDHVSITVSDLARSTAFYAKVLAPLGYEKLVTRATTVGFGKNYPEFWVNLRDGEKNPSGTHIALRARDRDAVDAFYDAALAGGGTGDGAPGFREAYSPRYYAAFIRDADDNRIEAVTFVEKAG